MGDFIKCIFPTGNKAKRFADFSRKPQAKVCCHMRAEKEDSGLTRLIFVWVFLKVGEGSGLFPQLNFERYPKEHILRSLMSTIS